VTVTNLREGVVGEDATRLCGEAGPGQLSEGFSPLREEDFVGWGKEKEKDTER
jgi:hypothetical protein